MIIKSAFFIFYLDIIYLDNFCATKMYSPKVTPVKNLVTLCLEGAPISQRRLSNRSKHTGKNLFGQFLSPHDVSRHNCKLLSPSQKLDQSLVSRSLFSPVKPSNCQASHFITPTKYKNKLSFDTGSIKLLSPSGLKEKTKGFVLGKGSYGIVVKGTYKNQNVAVKIIPKKNNSQACLSVASEMNAIKLKHPNIVEVFKVIEEPKNNMAFVFMNLYSHRNLETLIHNEIVPLQVKIKYLKEISSALCYCHQNKILHLDIKPKNVIVSDIKNIIKLCDFGSSQNLADTQKPRSLHMGTLKYSAPELLKGEIASVKSDVYSFGITMWEIIHQEIPYENEDIYVVIYKVVTQDYRPRLCKAPSNKLDNLVNIYQLCWETQQIKRPSMHQVQEMLEEISQNNFRV